MQVVVTAKRKRHCKQENLPRIYILTTPIVKLYFQWIFEVFLALLLTFLPAPLLGDFRYAVPLLLWALSEAVQEIDEMAQVSMDSKWREIITDYFSDRFNRFDAPAVALTMSTIISAISNERSAAEKLQTFSRGHTFPVYSADDFIGYPTAHVDIGPPSAVTSGLRAFACLFLWLRLMRILLLSTEFGPCVAHAAPSIRTCASQAQRLT